MPFNMLALIANLYTLLRRHPITIVPVGAIIHLAQSSRDLSLRLIAPAVFQKRAFFLPLSLPLCQASLLCLQSARAKVLDFFFSPLPENGVGWGRGGERRRRGETRRGGGCGEGGVDGRV